MKSMPAIATEITNMVFIVLTSCPEVVAPRASIIADATTIPILAFVLRLSMRGKHEKKSMIKTKPMATLHLLEVVLSSSVSFAINSGIPKTQYQIRKADTMVNAKGIGSILRSLIIIAMGRMKLRGKNEKNEDASHGFGIIPDSLIGLIRENG